MLNETQVQAYLDRIGYAGSRAPTLGNLLALQRAHAFSVPFENLDIHLGRHIPVDPARAYRKVVDQHRGGYCYELNPLFHALLSALGYDAEYISARILLRGDGHPFDHVVTVVRLDDDWLVDVGYGRQPPPMRIVAGAEASNENGAFKLQCNDGEFIVLGSTAGGSFEASYGFRNEARGLRDFDARSEWIQSSPDSIFTKAPICTLPSKDGRATLSGLNFIRDRQGKVESRHVSPEERKVLLKDIFGIDLGKDELPNSVDSTWIPGRGS